MRRATIAALALALAALGCEPSREIVNLKPPAGLPHLDQLGNHLDYVDPDAGKDNYIVNR